MRACLTLLVSLAVPASAALAQPASAGGPAAPAPAWTWTVSDTTRVEQWRFFAPPAGGGDPDYAFGGTRLFARATRAWPRLELTVAGQYVGLLQLPAAATGPGALGTGPLYFAQGGNRERPQQLYLRYAHVRFKNLAPGLDLRVGRQAYATGAEAASGDAKLEGVKRQRLDARLVGEFEWSLYQRAFDGVRVDWAGRAARVTGAALMPTQGGFARASNRTMTGIRLGGAAVTLPPSASRPRTEVQGFAWHYRDDRRVSGRPDNTGLGAARADVSVTTAGGSVVAARAAGPGELDALVWLAGQAGDWYGEPHRAWSVAAEGGYQWIDAAWAPWLRAGVLHASGDDAAADGRHGTFFPMLPTMRRFSQTTVYSTMNLDDLFAQLLVRPRADLSLRLDVHRLRLASAADLWYAGSGATLATGGNFGYVGRSAGGARDLGTSIETSAAWRVSPRWAVNGFVGHIAGGPVVRGSFAGDRLWFVYAEAGVRWEGSR